MRNIGAALRQARDIPGVVPLPGGTPEVGGAAIQLSQNFAFQSYFDSTLLSKALQSQPPNQPIVPAASAALAAAQSPQISGYGLGLHPSSQAPIAVQFKAGSRGSTSSVYTMKPGEVIWPFGGDPFSGFKYGLPFGWLGGGTATLVVLLSSNADVKWHGNPELIFHRARFAIKQPTDLTSGGSFNNAPKNWPMRFPWTQALQGSNSIPQQGNAQLAIVEPTKVIMALRTATAALANPSDMRVLFQGTNDLGLDSTDAVVLTNPLFETYTWPSYANSGTSGNLVSPDPIIVSAQGIARLAADDGGVLMLDLTGSAGLTGLFVDVCRYGRL